MMQRPAETRKILVTVRASPNPSDDYNETSCVAGVDMDRQVPVRLFPMPARFLNDGNRFKKYSIIEAQIWKSPSDTRPESHHVNFESVTTIGEIRSNPGDFWADRWEHVRHFQQGESLDELRRRIQSDGKSSVPSLTLVKPREILGFEMERKPNDDWSPAEIAKMNQQNMFLPNRPPGEQLEFIPYKFRYHFLCQDPRCTGHRPQILDWEISESYRQWTRTYGENWEQAVRQKYEHQLPNEKDLWLYMGTNNQYPESWMIIGLYYPPKAPL